MTSTTSPTLVDLTEWVRSLPLESFAPVGVLLVGGILLLAFGQKLLKPVLVFSSVFAGVILAVHVAQATQSTTSALIWSAGGAIAGFLVVVVSYRLALGFAVGAIAAVAAMLVATAATELGLIEVGRTPATQRAADGPTAVAGTLEHHADLLHHSEPLVAAAQAFVNDRDRAELASQAVAQELDRVAPGLGPSFLGWFERCQAFMASSGTWMKQRWDALPQPMRTLLFAAGAAGGFLGFVAGITSPVWAAATVTSLLGSLLTLLCGVPLASRFLPDGTVPELTPLAWLGAWVLLAFAGGAFQWFTRHRKNDAAARGRAKEEELASARSA